MARLFTIIICAGLLSACYQNPPEVTFDMNLVLPRDTMVVVMTELQLVDGAVNLTSKQGKKLSEYASTYTEQVLEKHGISEEMFKESIRYYSFHVEELDKIYEEVIIRLGKIESEVNQGN